MDKTTLEFFKVDEKRLNNGSWASDELIANNASWAVTIPSTIAPGNYVLRYELIALHGAGSVDGAQLYPFSINLEVTGRLLVFPMGPHEDVRPLRKQRSGLSLRTLEKANYKA